MGGRHLGVFDGGYALGNVVRPLVRPEVGAARIDFLTRLRHDARLYALPPKEAQREEGAEAEMGQEAGSTSSGRSVGRALARRLRLYLRAEAKDLLEGGGVLVVRPRF